MAGLLLLSGCSAPGSPQARERGDSEREIRISAPAESVSTLELLRQKTTPPNRVRVPELGIDMPVEAHGLEGNGDMSLPFSPQTAGWYEYGSAPDSRSGSTVIAAHVDQLGEGAGPFRELRNATEGMAVSVIDEAGVTHEYRVTTVERIDKDEVPLDRVFTAVGDPHVVLVTCGGDFDGVTRTYLHNYIVTAEKVA